MLHLLLLSLVFQDKIEDRPLVRLCAFLLPTAIELACMDTPPFLLCLPLLYAVNV